MNDSIRELQELLVGRVQKLSMALDDVTKPEEAEALVREMQEVNHRVTLTGQLLFKEQSDQLSEAVARAVKARAGADKAIQQLADLNTGLKVLTRFLSLVDEALDLAKMLPAA